jgi:hypothetical protein
VFFERLLGACQFFYIYRVAVSFVVTLLKVRPYTFNKSTSICHQSIADFVANHTDSKSICKVQLVRYPVALFSNFNWSSENLARLIDFSSASFTNLPLLPSFKPNQKAFQIWSILLFRSPVSMENCLVSES